ncbi:hypothetical protein [Bartonella sp. TS82HLJMH]|uniref:hypothetical protein n=1 Tax=Bartonella sp. TS82HLJMH TaxID=3243577 RepID=UPI0035CFD163
MWIKTVQERIKNASYEPSHIPKTVTALKASKVRDECRLAPFISINMMVLNGFTIIPFIDSVAKWAWEH